MGEGNGVSDGGTPPVSMDDLKSLETTLTSSMNTQMEELRAKIGRASCRERVFRAV